MRVFPQPGTNLYQFIYDVEFKAAFHKKIKQGNRWVVFMKKLGLLPLLRFGTPVMVLTTRGRKSHQLRETPIGYCHIDHEIHVFSGWGENANWFQNIRACPEDVYIQTGFSRLPARAEIITDDQERNRIYQRLVVQNPAFAHALFGWSANLDSLPEADFTPLIDHVVIVRFHPFRKSERS